ncbi:helicase-exonuclease AddAB subunit AddA [Paenibacillus sp. P96]|uniref:ATP-dependent helicase/nuclease subunit A n=1 Tax=Paenibacillus zeirhizosphaerae TaxID=2987519 RepID=A0ABT9FQV1_9BACL|nr:helicase-exonuclease AddAB subunit AddA [Paenibacillus sp. P96]MDP4096995.1 helicase-exonuclease AddAB subunit AddA [Paenibacillus sp. P96]
MFIPKPEGSFWSDEQWQAIVQSGDDMLVAAAAGSGKTAVLVERIIRKIADPTLGFSVDRLLVATFTKAAAAEMRHRIREALERALEDNPGSEHLQRQLSLLGRASITTLHSFCMEVIRRHYQSIPLDPGFRIMNEHETELMRQELLEELFEEKYGEQPEGSVFRMMVDWFSGERTDDAVYGLVQRLYDFSQSHPWPGHWLRETVGAFRIGSLSELGATSWVASLMSDARLELRGVCSLLEQAHGLAMEPGGPAPYAQTLADETEMVRTLQLALEQEPWERLYDRFQTVSFGKLKAVKKDQTDPELQERVKSLRERAKKALTDLKATLFGRSPEQFLAELRQAAPLMEELAETVIQFGERFRREKQEKGLVDFADLEHYCLQILRHPDSTPAQLLPSDAALEYQAQFDEVLLDEYQDTNTVQEDIVRLLARSQPGNRFMVGDVKQSIYRFRLAEPGLFLDKYRRFGEKDEPGLLIDLARNFRSRREVVDAVNLLFRQMMSVDVAEIDYDERARLVHGADFPEAAEQSGTPYQPELILIDKGASGSSIPADAAEEGTTAPEEELAELETAQLEARLIAGRIRQIVGDTGPALQVYDKGLKTMRPAVYGDIVILLRSAAVWAPLIVEELRQAGIPAAGEQTKGFFKATEIEVMLSLLHIIDNPRQDIPLASVLRSPMVGLTEDELARIRLKRSNGSFYDAVMAAAGRNAKAIMTATVEAAVSSAGGEDEAGRAEAAEAMTETALEQGFAPSETKVTADLQRFLDKLEAWRQEAVQGSLSSLIWRIYEETGYMDWNGGLPGGVQRQNNLKTLYDRALQYEQTTSNRGLFRFLTFISRLRENGRDLGPSGVSTEPDQAVRIMTIHKSKGLEFPVVFIAGAAKMFNTQDLNMPFLMHKGLGFGPKFVDNGNRVSYPTLPNLAIRRRSQLELLAEEMRVLYVALTRPREKMIITATVRNAAAQAASWAAIKDEREEVLPDYLLAAGRSYLDWIGPALLRHPSASVLREAAGLQPEAYRPLEGNEGGWLVSLYSAEAAASIAAADAGPETELLPDRSSRVEALRQVQPVHSAAVNQAGQLANALSWTYPHALAGRTAASTSATELKRTVTGEEPPSADWTNVLSAVSGETSVQQPTFERLQLRRPKFMEQKGLSPSERGTVYHTLMFHLPLQGSIVAPVIEETKERLVQSEIMSRQHADMIDAGEITRFFATELGQRLLHASSVQRELPFSYGLPASQLANRQALDIRQPGGTTHTGVAAELEGDTVLVKGIVDCLFEDEKGLVLLDYKTDQISEFRNLEVLTGMYRFQLELYSRVMEDILGRKIAERWLYFFDAGESVQV